MSTLDLSFIERFSWIFRRMDTDFPGERENAAHALYHLCANQGVKIVDVAMALVNSWQQGKGETAERKFTEEEVVIIFKRGVEKGRAESGGQTLSADYFDSDGYPRWDAMVKFCREQPTFASLKPNEREFIDEMPAKLRWRAPTRPMGGFLLSIFWKLGGSFK